MGLFRNDADKMKASTGFEVVAASRDIGMLMEEEMQGLMVRFDRVRMPAAADVAAAAAEVAMAAIAEAETETATDTAATTTTTVGVMEKDKLSFEVLSGATGQLLRKTELLGVIVDKHPLNLYYACRFGGQNVAPDCSSLDGKTGYGSPGGSCSACPMNRYGTGIDENGNGTRGKACQNKYRIYLLQSGDSLPMLLTLGASSLKSFGDYLAKQIVAKGRKSHAVITKITLREAISAAGFPYAVVQFAVSEALDERTVAQVLEYSSCIQQLTRQLPVYQDNEVAQLQ